MLLKKPVSVVLASFRPSTYHRGYAFVPSLTAALLSGVFEQPTGSNIEPAPVAFTAEH